MAEPWPRRYHLHIAQKHDNPDFGGVIINVLEQDPKCIVIESKPRAVSKTSAGDVKWRECIVRIRDAKCMFAMRARFQNQSIALWPKSV